MNQNVIKNSESITVFEDWKLIAVMNSLLVKKILASLLILLHGSGIAQSSLVSVEVEKYQRRDRLIVKNGGAIAQTIDIRLTQSTNTAASLPWPVKRLIHPYSTVLLNELWADNPRQPFFYHYQFDLRIGNPSARPDMQAKYLPPFFWPEARYVSQAEGSAASTHNDIASHYALDILMPIGTPIMASREGIVIANVNHFPDDGRLEKSFLGKDNHVIVLHGDGTWASYAHLKQYSSQLKPGQRIATGSPIGLSGNSGYSSAPHLHFVVQINQDNHIVALPFRFWNPANGYFRPKTGEWLQPVKIAVNETGTKKPLRSCQKNGNLIDEEVLKCMQRF